MIFREYAEEAIAALPDKLRVRMKEYISDADDRFMSITVPDSGKRMAAVAERDTTDRGWWWFRIPDSGPILEDLARWNRYEEA